MRRLRDVVAFVATTAACAHGVAPRSQTASSPETAASTLTPATTVSGAPTAAADPRQPEARHDEPGEGSTAPVHLPQPDPIPPPRPRCPSVAALVTASAVVKREPPSRTQHATSPDVLDIELIVTLPSNSTQATFPQNYLTVAGGVLIKETHQADHTKAVVLIRPSGTVAHEGSMFALFGLACSAGEGNLRVDLTFAIPMHHGDPVTVRHVEGY
jgi:hypothetical protein